MLALKNPKMQFGTKLKLSKTDIMQLNAIYDCKSKCLFQIRAKYRRKRKVCILG